MPFARPRPRPFAAAAALCCVLALSACDAGPTAPTSFAQQVGGRTWVAVTPPDGLPDARSWMPFVRRTDPAYPRLHELREMEAQARKAGQLEHAAALATVAARLAAKSAVSPDPEALLRAQAALERWEARAAERLAEGAYPGLDSTRAAIHGLRGQADAAVQRGDTTAAVADLTEAGEAARTFAPEAVGLRVLADAEARIAGAGPPTQGLKRARRLLRAAREAIATGDCTRAVRRAMYALQIIDAELAGGAGEPAGG
ncbi:MAG: hypothetical protein JWM27_2868 [Gemmatimonadetes bacterium]|nr:hypothetical protein [Gemmatimonadota bacterium]